MSERLPGRERQTPRTRVHHRALQLNHMAEDCCYGNPAVSTCAVPPCQALTPVSISVTPESGSALFLGGYRMRRMVSASFALAWTIAAVHVSGAPLDSVEPWRFDAGDWRLDAGRLTQTDVRIIPHAFLVAGAEAYSDCTVRVRFRAHDDGEGVKAAGLVLRSTDSVSGYRIHFDTENDQIIVMRHRFGSHHAELMRRRGVRMDTGTWYVAETSITGAELVVRLDGDEWLRVTDPDPVAGGVPGLYTSQGKVDFEDLTIEGTSVTLESPWRQRMTYEVPEQQALAEILWIKPICKQPGRYIGWPTICRRSNNELLVVFSGDRDQHVCPWGKVQLVRSSDDGDTWTAPVTACNTPLDDRDAGIIETPGGALVVNWFTSLAFEGAMRGEWLRKLESDDVLAQWARHAEKLTPEIREAWFGYWTRRSTDGGTTWEAPVRHSGSAPHGGIVLTDGRLLFVGTGTDKGKRILTVEESRDDGRSWQQIATVPQNPDDNPHHYYEPHVVETADGRLVAMFRFHYHEDGKGRRDEAKCLLRQSESDDGGRTWTTCHTTVMQGYPGHLTRLTDGQLLCVYGRRRPPYGEYACISRDGGRTWDIENEIHLAAATSGDLGYPASAQLADGSILTVYYQIAQQGEKTCLMATRWRLR